MASYGVLLLSNINRKMVFIVKNPLLDDIFLVKYSLLFDFQIRLFQCRILLSDSVKYSNLYGVCLGQIL